MREVTLFVWFPSSPVLPYFLSPFTLLFHAHIPNSFRQGCLHLSVIGGVGSGGFYVVFFSPTTPVSTLEDSSLSHMCQVYISV